jgi:hypothetical protein
MTIQKPITLQGSKIDRAPSRAHSAPRAIWRLSRELPRWGREHGLLHGQSRRRRQYRGCDGPQESERRDPGMAGTLGDCRAGRGRAGRARRVMTAGPCTTVLAATNKCLAQNNKSRTGVPATNKGTGSAAQFSLRSGGGARRLTGNHADNERSTTYVWRMVQKDSV